MMEGSIKCPNCGSWRNYTGSPEKIKCLTCGTLMDLESSKVSPHPGSDGSSAPAEAVVKQTVQTPEVTMPEENKGENLQNMETRIRSDIDNLEKTNAKLSQGKDGKLSLDINVNDNTEGDSKSENKADESDKKAWQDIAKKIGGAAKSGAKGGVKLGGKALGGAITGGPIFFLMVAILGHIGVILYTKLAVSTLTFAVILVFSAILGILYYFSVGEIGRTKIMELSIATAVVYALPALGYQFIPNDNVSGFFFWLAVFCPPWILYMLQRLAQGNPEIGKIFKVYKLLLLIAFFILFLGLMFSQC